MITRPAILLLSYKRYDLTAKVLAHNLQRTGVEVGLFVADIKGIAKATNDMLVRAVLDGYDGFVICGNDILENENWIKRRMDFINANPKAGMVSVPVDKTVAHPSDEMVIGNFMISKATFDLIGGMDERYDPYGAIDLDYNKRCLAAGLTNYYLPNDQANHIHYHNGVELYGYNKEDKVRETWELHTSKVENYNIPIINYPQFVGEQTINR